MTSFLGQWDVLLFKKKLVLAVLGLHGYAGFFL